MTTALIWLEGVNFAEHLDDTQHLSVIRGGSLALLATGDEGLRFLTEKYSELAPSPVFTGASQALFRLNADEIGANGAAKALLDHLHSEKLQGYDPDKISAAARNAAKPPLPPPFPHLAFVAGVAPDDGTRLGPQLAQARARVQQLQGGLPRRASANASHDCKLSGHKVGDITLTFSAEHAAKYNITDKPLQDKNGGKQPVSISKSAAARWHYGRAARQRFYAETDGCQIAKALKELGHSLEGRSFTENLQDMLDLNYETPADESTPPAIKAAAKVLRDGLPLALRGKLAVFYADGNGFGAIRDALGGTPEALKTFSDGVRPVMHKAIAALLGVVMAHHRSPIEVLRQAGVYHDADSFMRAQAGLLEDQIRFETLLYGGDEIGFVAPSWFGLAMAEAFFAAVKGEMLQGHALTFKAGLVFAPGKMPIAASRALAKKLADTVQDGAANRLGIQAFESVEPPAGGLSGMRHALFGEVHLNNANTAQGKPRHPGANWLALDGDRFGETLDELRTATGTGAGSIPRSQLYRALRIGQWQKSANEQRKVSRALGEAEANQRVADIFKAYFAGPADDSGDRPFRAALQDPHSAALCAWLISHVWDYVDPVARAVGHVGGQGGGQP